MVRPAQHRENNVRAKTGGPTPADRERASDVADMAAKTTGAGAGAAFLALIASLIGALAASRVSAGKRITSGLRHGRSDRQIIPKSRDERPAMRALMRDLARGAFTYAPPALALLERAIDIDRQISVRGRPSLIALLPRLPPPGVRDHLEVAEFLLRRVVAPLAGAGRFDDLHLVGCLCAHPRLLL